MKLNNELDELMVELKEQRNILDTIINSTSDLLVLKDRKSVYQHVNSAFCKFLSIAEDELKTTKDDLKIKIDERTAELESAVTLLKDEMNDRRKAEKSLLIKDRAIESSINAICITDPEANITYVNSSFIKMWGYDNKEEVLGKSALGFWHYPQKAVDVIKTLNERGNWVGELNARKKDGTLFDVQLAATIVKEGSGTPLCMMGSFLDITERKKAEDALKKAHMEIAAWSRELEQRVKEKTKELLKAQSQLIQSEKLSAMGEMAGGLAHELNSPLAGLLPMIEHYKNNAEKGSKTYNELSLMHKACEYMAKIVNDFSSFSRESKGEFTELNLNDAINDTMNFSISRIKQKRIQLIKEYDDNLPSVYGEKTELQQVILNMITNALDAMTEGGTFNIKTSSRDNNNVIMEFIDNGSGIEKDKLDRIFDPFYTTKRPGKGTGLGLSISYKIIEKHRGKISAESEPGQGTKFEISLPAAKTNTA